MALSGHFQSAVLWSILPAFVCGCSSNPAAPYEGKSIAELQTMLRHGSPEEQTQGAFGLARMGAEAKEAVPALTEALSSPELRVRVNAALALGQIGPEARAAVPALQAALADGDWTMRRQAALALGRIGQDARPALADLDKLRQDGDPLVRKAAEEAISAIGK